MNIQELRQELMERAESVRSGLAFDVQSDDGSLIQDRSEVQCRILSLEATLYKIRTWLDEQENLPRIRASKL